MELRDSKTKINLLRAFAGESQARNRYDIAAEKVYVSIQLIRKKLMQKRF